jgi:hypothetical protein
VRKWLNQGSIPGLDLLFLLYQDKRKILKQRFSPYFFTAPFDTPPLAGGREEMVSLLEEGLREVTNINYHIFIILKRVFYLSKSSPQTESDTRQSHQTWIPLQRGKCFF